MKRFLKIRSIEFNEIQENHTTQTIPEFRIDDFNLIIGDNAQGKTRFIRTLKYIAKAISGEPRHIESVFHAKFQFNYIISNEIKNLTYIIDVSPDGSKNKFKEEIISDEEILFSTKSKTLINEDDKSVKKDFFIPSNIPAVSSIEGKGFYTIELLKNFFKNITFIDSMKSREIILDISNAKHISPNPEGTNLSTVLNNWQTEFPDRYTEILNEFSNIFSFVKNLHFVEKPLPHGIIPKLIAHNEEKLHQEITQVDWSDGMHRTLHILMSTRVPFVINSQIEESSLIIIDEIENGLDFKTLKYIISYLKDYSDQSQIFITSHSPLVCEFIHPKHWLVVKRDGPLVKFLRPIILDQDIEKTLNMFKQKHWDLYTKSISNSKLYQ